MSSIHHLDPGLDSKDWCEKGSVKTKGALQHRLKCVTYTRVGSFVSRPSRLWTHDRYQWTSWVYEHDESPSLVSDHEIVELLLEFDIRQCRVKSQGVGTPDQRDVTGVLLLTKCVTTYGVYGGEEYQVSKKEEKEENYRSTLKNCLFRLEVIILNFPLFFRHP